ncbi:unnamed protein product [Blepharisma stoltei]|uniref:Uncharacterized protein n=1 Tax=Blepharisma stoltei TaxID=1481888 RepID=A0AAU9IMW9_9CILI|nr:unnamed protein product [Blepharisma stoltei]
MEKGIKIRNKTDSRRVEILKQALNDIKNKKISEKSDPLPSFSQFKSIFNENGFHDDNFQKESITDRQRRSPNERLFASQPDKSPIRSLSTQRNLNNDYRKMHLEQLGRKKNDLLKDAENGNLYPESIRMKNERNPEKADNFPYMLGVGGSPFRNVHDKYSSGYSKAPRRLEPLFPDHHFVKVYKTGKIIQDKYFIVEVSKDHKVLKIMIYNLEDPEKFGLEISLKDAKKLIGDAGNYEKLVEMVKLEGNELMLIEDSLTNENEDHPIVS